MGRAFTGEKAPGKTPGKVAAEGAVYSAPGLGEWEGSRVGAARAVLGSQ